jgi:hypothetical protein
VGGTDVGRGGIAMPLEQPMLVEAFGRDAKAKDVAEQFGKI